MFVELQITILPICPALPTSLANAMRESSIRPATGNAAICSIEDITEGDTSVLHSGSISPIEKLSAEQLFNNG